MRKILGGATAAVLALTIAAAPVFAGGKAVKPGSSTIVDIVLADDGEFDVLQAAVIRAGLAGVLSSTADQFTVFAPTDAAFEKTFGASEGALKAAVNSGALDGSLTDILLYHVTNGRRTSTSVVHAPSYVMLNGDKLTRSQLFAAGISAVDISASNGIIHVIDSVLLP